MTGVARRIRRGVKEPVQRALAWAAVRTLDVRPRTLEEVRALKPRAIVAVRTDRIGDLLVSTPLIAALHRRWPDARLVVVTGPKNRAALEGLPFVEAGPVFDRHPASWARVARWFDGQPFDLAVSLCAEAMSGVYVSAASGAPVRVATHATKTAPAFNFIFGVDDHHHVTRNCRAAAMLGVPCAQMRPTFEIPEAERERAEQAVGSRWGAEGGPLVGVQVPSRSDRLHARQSWPSERLVELVGALAADGCRVVLFGVGSERVEAERIRVVVPAAELAPEGTLGFAAALLTRLDLLVSGFTGTYHLADAVGVPTVAIGTAHKVLYWGSHGPSHRLAVAERLTDVTLGGVLETVRGALAAGGARP
jgi:ADP-heptose:LPS heptosyltransferase